MIKYIEKTGNLNKFISGNPDSLHILMQNSVNFNLKISNELRDLFVIFLIIKSKKYSLK